MKRPLLFAAIALSVVLGLTRSAAQIPRLLSYQGILTDTLGVPKPDGMWSVTFRLYDVQSGGSALWTEAKTLQTKSGLFSTVLGDQVVIPASLKFDKPYWLGIQVGAQPELAPRILLTAVGYTLHSAAADTAKYALSAPVQGVIDSARAAGITSNLKLPLSASINTALAYGLIIQNNGTGDGIRAYSNSTTQDYAGLYAFNLASTGTGTGVYGGSYHGDGVVAYSQGFDALDASTDQAGRSCLYAHTVNGNGAYCVSTNATAVTGISTHNYGGMFSSTDSSGGRFVSTNSYGADLSSTNNYGARVISTTFRGLYAESASGYYAAYIASRGGSGHAGLYVDGTLVTTGAKTGYVADIALNDGTESLEQGDVVAITGYAPPVYGERIPIIRVSKARVAETAAVAGVVDDHYIVTPGVMNQGAALAASARGMEPLPHAAPRSASGSDGIVAGPGEYMSVVTLGAFIAVKVDASYGAIQPGDLLVASPNPGYAMKAASPKTGTVIGKAMGSLAGGTGKVPVFVTMH